MRLTSWKSVLWDSAIVDVAVFATVSMPVEARPWLGSCKSYAAACLGICRTAAGVIWNNGSHHANRCNHRVISE
jgi:hypothetical protein